VAGAHILWELVSEAVSSLEQSVTPVESLPRLSTGTHRILPSRASLCPRGAADARAYIDSPNCSLSRDGIDFFVVSFGTT
jgi:hypothetical protein